MARAGASRVFVFAFVVAGVFKIKVEAFGVLSFENLSS